MNRVQLMGRMAADLEIKYTNSGTAVLNFRVATNKKWIDKQSGQKQERVEFHNCVCYDKGAETINKFSAKGKRIFVEGELKNNSWEDKQTGQKRYTTEINVNSFEIVDFVEAPQQGYNNPNPTYTQTPQTLNQPNNMLPPNGPQFAQHPQHQGQGQAMQGTGQKPPAQTQYAQPSNFNASDIPF